MYRWMLLWLIWGFFFNSFHAQAEDTVIRNLRWDWEAYDHETHQFVPFFGLTKTKTIRFEVDLNKYRNSFVKLALPAHYFIWIDSQLVQSTSASEVIYLRLDSLNDLLDTNKVILSIFSEDFKENELCTEVVYKRNAQQAASNTEAQPKRQRNKLSDSFIISSLLILSLVAVFRAYNYRLFLEFFSIERALRQRQNFDLIIAHAPLAWPNIGFILFYALLVGSMAFNLDLYSKPEALLSLSLFDQDSLMIGLKVSAYCFLLMILKFWNITLGTALFKIKKVRQVHFFTYFRHSLIIAIIGFSLSVINAIFDGHLFMNGQIMMKVLIVIVWSGRFILIFFVLNKIYTFRKLHLFSYLCSTELIPLLLLFKIFLK